MPERSCRCWRGCRQAAPRTTRTGRTRSSGTACARSPTAEGGRVRIDEPQPARRDRRSTRSCARSAASSAHAELVLDGEIVALRRARPARTSGGSSTRMHVARESAVKRRMADTPVVYMIFDLLYLDGHSTMALPYDRAARAARPARASTARTGGPRRTTSATARRWWRRAASRASRESLPSASTAATSRARAAARWLKIKNQPPPGVRRRRLAAGQGAGARTGSARWRVGYYDGRGAAIRRQRRHRVSRSTTLSGLKRACWSRCARTRARSSGRQPPKGTDFVRARAGRRGRVR